jgi:hypothetical protein
VAKWKISKHELQRIRQRPFQFAHDKVCFPAMRTLKIAVLEQYDARIRRPALMIGFTNGKRQIGFALRSHVVTSCRELIFSSARRMPSAPGLTPTGDK